MFIVHFFDQVAYEFHMSLHETRAEAEVVVDELISLFEINNSMSGAANPTRD
jgi:hypothetical protein